MFAIAAFILITIVLMAQLGNRWRLPLVLIALSTGIIFGSDITGLVYFDNAILAKRLADSALVVVLFCGGFVTKKETLKLVMAPALVLATLGVIITAAVTGLSLNWIFDFGLTYAFLLGAIIASTDAAAVFSILRSRAVSPRLSAITEIESATNDPMAILLTTFIIQIATAKTITPLAIGFGFAWQLTGGLLIGLLIGKLGCILFDRSKAVDRGYFYVLIIGVILLSFGIADLAKASGMLSSFFAGFAMGNAAFPYKRNIATFLDALSTISNVGIFVLLGLLVFPKEFASIWPQGVVVFLILTFVSRPIAVVFCTLFTKFSIKDKIFMSWSGLRGAVPIVLATYPAAAGIENAKEIFNIIFFAVTISILVQGTTLNKMAQLFKLTGRSRPKPDQVMELVTIHASDLELCELHIDDDIYEGTVSISSLKLPQNTTITMINRKEMIIAPQGATEIHPGDILYILINNRMIESVMNEILSHFNTK